MVRRVSVATGTARVVTFGEWIDFKRGPGFIRVNWKSLVASLFALWLLEGVVIIGSLEMVWQCAQEAESVAKTAVIAFCALICVIYAAFSASRMYFFANRHLLILE